MTPDEILRRVAQILAALFGVNPAAIRLETTALEIYAWDSITHVHLLLEVEKVFGFEFPEERAFDMANVGDLVEVIQGCLAAKGG